MKFIFRKAIALKMLFLFTAFFTMDAHAQELLLGWNANNNGGGFGISPWAPETLDSSIQTQGLIRGSNIGTSGSPAVGCWGGAGGWIGMPDGTFYFTMKAPGHKISLSSISTATRRSNSGPQNYFLSYSINGGEVLNAGTGSTTATSGTTGTPNSHSLTGISELQDMAPGTEITFYIRPAGSSGNYYLTGGVNSLRVNGTKVGPPAGPEASPQEFCGTAIVADLVATGTDLKWYATADSTNVLTPETTITSGTYYVTQTVAGFESLRTAVVVTINELPAAPTAEAQFFCEAVTVADLAPSSQSVMETFGTTTRALAVGNHTFESGVWSLLSPTAIVNVANSYSGAALHLATTAAILSPEFEELKTVSFYAKSAGGNPTGHSLRILKIVNGVETLVQEINMNGITTHTLFSVNINESAPTRIKFERGGTEGIRSIDNVTFNYGVGAPIRWYNTETGGTPLAQDTPLQTGTYYVTQTGNNCESPRTAVHVSVSDVPNAPTIENQTFCGAATVADLAVEGMELNWYATADSEEILTPETALSNGTYYVSQTVNRCESPRTAVEITITELPAAPLAEAQTFCGEATVADLTPQSVSSNDIIFQDSFDNLNNWNVVNVLGSKVWGITTFGNPSNSALMNGFQENNEDWLVLKPVSIPATASSATFSFDSASNYSGPNLEVFYTTNYTGDVNTTTWTALSPTLSTTGYFVWLNSGSVNVSPAIGSDLVVAFKYTSSTGTNNAKAWEIDNFKIETNESTTINWYASLEATETLTPETELQTGTYYVSQIVNGCESERAPVEITVNEIPAAPIAEDQAFCGEATVADLIPATIGGDNLVTEDFNVADFLNFIGYGNEGTIELPTGTWTLNNAGIFNESLDVRGFTISPVLNNVKSMTFTGTTPTNIVHIYKIVNDVETLVESVSFTGNQSQTIEINHFDEDFQIKLQTNNISAPVIYHSITFDSGSENSINWYDVPEDGAPLSVETELVTGTYYVSQTVNGCEGERTAVEVTLNEIPVAPVAEAQVFCGETTVFDLTAEGTEIKWYATEISEDALASETVVTTGTYYVSQTSAQGCESERVAVEITVNEIPAAPVAEAQAFCGEATIEDLTVEGTEIKWYATENSEEALAAETVLETGTYYVSQTSAEGCESERTAVEITVNEIPTAPVTEAQVFCGDATIADLTAEGTEIKWYATAGSEEALTPETILETGAYFVSQTANGCESERIEVEVTINKIPTAPIADAQIFCGEATIADLIVEGTEIKWYITADSEEELTSETVLENGTYYVSQSTTEGCESARTAVEVTINEIPDAPIAVNPQEYEAGATLADLIVEGENLTWYDADGNILDPSTILVDGEVYYVSQTVNGCESEQTEIEANQLGSKETDFSNFSYYPNPVKNVLHFSNDETIKQVLVFTLTGELVLTQNVNSKKTELNLNHLTSATYIVKVVTDKETKTVKIIKK